MDVKIIDKEPMEFSFKDVPKGGVFQLHGTFFVKAIYGDIWSGVMPTAIRTGEVAHVNALRLEDGTLYYIPKDQKVYIPNKAVLHVEW